MINTELSGYSGLGRTRGPKWCTGTNNVLFLLLKKKTHKLGETLKSWKSCMVITWIFAPLFSILLYIYEMLCNTIFNLRKSDKRL